MNRDAQACPVCASPHTTPFAEARDAEYYTSNRVFAYRACGECGSLYLPDPPVDELHAIYPRNYYSYQFQQTGSLIERIKERLDARLFRKLLQKIEGDRLNVLDVGGGSGWLLTLVRKVSGRVQQTHEIDIDENARAGAEAAGHIFHCSSVEAFSSSLSFDLILMLNLIEHVADPAAVLRSMQKLLSPGGLILIKTPNVDTLDCRLFRHRNWGGFHCPRHFVLFNRQSLVALGERCGLTLVSASYTQGAPQWTCSILGWLGLNGWLRVSADRPLYTHPLYQLTSAVTAIVDFIRSAWMPTAQMFVVFRPAGSKTPASD
jgi:SAM-dependent methyltransferase